MLYVTTCRRDIDVTIHMGCGILYMVFHFTYIPSLYKLATSSNEVMRHFFTLFYNPDQFSEDLKGEGFIAYEDGCLISTFHFSTFIMNFPYTYVVVIAMESSGF